VARSDGHRAMDHDQKTSRQSCAPAGDSGDVRAVWELSVMVQATTNPLTEISANTPLRLAVAAKIAFPDGSITAQALRREASRGRLTIERIAGKDYTTLANIERMRDLCRVQAKVPDFTFGPRGATPPATSPITRPGSSETVDGTFSQAALQTKLHRLSNA
jgi:hypothetical protein